MSKIELDVEYVGVFWEPGIDAPRLSGALKFSNHSDILTLLSDSDRWKPEHLPRPTDPEPTFDRLFGTVLGLGDVTLLHARSNGRREDMPHLTSLEFTGFTAIIGTHSTSDEYSSLRLELEYLNGWAPARPIAERTDDGWSIPMVDETQTTTTVNDSVLSIERYVANTWSIDEVSARNVWSFWVRGSISIDEIAASWAPALQDFLMVAVGYRPNLLGAFLGLSQGSSAPFADLRTWWPRMGPSDRESPRLIRHLPDSRTLLLPDDELLPLATALSTWFASKDDLRAPIALLSASLIAGVELEARFLSLFVAFDALTKPLYPRQEIQPDQHNIRVESVRSALLAAGTESSICGWAIEQLKRSNQKGQQTIVEEGLAGSGIIPNEHVNPLAKLLNDIRVDIAHKGIVRKIHDDTIAVRFYYLAELLEWLVRHEILIRLGVPREQLSARITGNARFRDLLTQLGQLGMSNAPDR